MRRDRRSHDLYNTLELTVQICPFKFYESDLTFLNQQLWFIMWFGHREFQLSNPSFLRTSIFQSQWPVDTCPSQLMALPLLRGFYLSNRSTVMCPLSQSTVEIHFKDSMLSLSSFLRSILYPEFWICRHASTSNQQSSFTLGLNPESTGLCHVFS